MSTQKYMHCIRVAGLTVGALLLLLAPVAAADDRWYEVQIIVFEHRAGVSTEEWPANPRAPDTANAQSLRGYAGQNRRVPFSLVQNPNNVLNDHWRRLDQSDNYRPLLRTGWIQPGQDRNNARAVRIRDNERIELDGSMGTRGFGGDGEESRRGPVYRLDGQITVSLGRFLHLRTDLAFAEILDADQAPTVGEADSLRPGWLQADARLQRYVLQDSRRMRSSELHYIDHPRFGVIARIVPLD